MPTVNPVTEARGFASKLGNAVAALSQAVSLPIAQPYRDILSGMATQLQQMAIAVQEQAASNQQMTDTGQPMYLAPNAPGQMAPAPNPDAIAALMAQGSPPGMPGPGMPGPGMGQGMMPNG